MKTQSIVLRRLYEYGTMTLGCAIYALCFNWFFQPNSIAMGGFTGLAQIINRLIPAFPVGMTVLVMNIPLLILGVRKQGLKLLIATLYATAVSSLMIDGLAMVYTFPAMDPLLACIYGGVLLGVSMGLLMLMGGTTGGSDLAARLLKYKLHSISIGRLCLFIDAVVVSLYALTFHSLNNALYGIVSMYICSVAMDAVVYGSNAKMAYIISARSGEIAGHLLEMNLGVTLLNGRGGFSGDEKQVVLCAFKRSQIAPIKATVTALDPAAFITMLSNEMKEDAAFIIVCEAHEVLGEGFGEYSPDSL